LTSTALKLQTSKQVDKKFFLFAIFCCFWPEARGSVHKGPPQVGQLDAESAAGYIYHITEGRATKDYISVQI